jgi:hypothetical protein
MLNRAGAVALLVFLGTALPTTSAHADQRPCPTEASGFILWHVDTAPYEVDNFVDAAGNHNGWVCARELPRTFVEDGVEYPAQNFIDDRS